MDTIIRIDHSTTKPYVMIRRDTLQDASLSWEARGMLAYLLSKPDDWKVKPEDLQQSCGRDKVYRILDELKDAHYVNREQVRDPKTKHVVASNYIVYEEPHPSLVSDYIEKHDDLLPEKPDTALPDTENTDSIHNTESQKKESVSDSSLRSESSTLATSNSTNAEAQSKQGEGSTEGQPFPVASPSGSLTKDKAQDGKSSARVAKCFTCNCERTWTLHGDTKNIYRCEVCGSLVAENILWPEQKIVKIEGPSGCNWWRESAQQLNHLAQSGKATTLCGLKVDLLACGGIYDTDCPDCMRMVVFEPPVQPGEGITPPEGYQLMSGTASDAPIHLRKAGQSLKAKPLCKAPLAYRLMPTPDMARSRKPCEECWKIATTPQQPKVKREKKPQPWDVLGEAIAKELFGAKDKAGVSAVFGRIAPVLHGDKRSGRCIGLIAYECEKQDKDKAELDYQALADMVPKFWKEYQRDNPGVTALKDCAKVLDAWQAWRGKKPKVRLEDLYEPVEPTESYIAPGPAR